jgi:omega-6 fatty acid desaturase (delta-12 desaturase)
MTPSTLSSTATSSIQPIPEGLPIPNRKVIRSWIEPFAQKQTLISVFLLSADFLIWLALIAGVIFVPSLLAKIILGNIAGFWIGRLFILGHDACHQSYTPHRELNKALGRIAFLPSLTPYSLWEVGHNVVHHGQTNLKGFDFVWAPASLEEFQAMPVWRQNLERLYRSGWGPVFYYLIEIWWNKMFFPNSSNMPSTRKVFLKDNLLVSAFAVIWLAVLAYASFATNQSLLTLMVCGFVIPYLFWNGMIGWVVYVHHTHPSVSWYDNKSEWMRAQPFVSTTVHLTFKYNFGAMMHHIMEHTAHHVDMGVPLYELKNAQGKLEELLPGRIIKQAFSWSWYFETAKLCKLYDFQNKCWTDFNGNKTAESIRVVLSPQISG